MERKKKKPYQNAILSVIEIIDYIINVKNIMMNHLNQ